MKISEHDEQVALVKWFRLQYSKYKHHLFAIPNGAHLAGDVKIRSIKMHKMKSEGFVNGIADLFLMIPNENYHGLFIEMKSINGVLSDDQKEFRERAKNMGYKSVVCWGFDEAKTVIDEYLILNN